ncbi:hydrophobin [Trametes polyzona]|nr:hydrophobin [Trametes polyzona]
MPAMFSKLFVLATVFATLAAATPTPGAGGPTCQTGSLQCCNSLQDPSSKSMQSILALLGLGLQDTDAQVGLDCNPISVIGVDNKGGCSQQTACCDDHAVANGVSVGCLPVTAL